MPIDATEGSHRLADWVHRTLLTGSILSAGLLAAGLAVTLIQGQPRPEGPPPSGWTILREVARGEGAGLIDLGLFALMATPIVRVAVLAVGWGIDRQWRFLGVAVAVLVLLSVGLFLGMAG